MKWTKKQCKTYTDFHMRHGKEPMKTWRLDGEYTITAELAKKRGVSRMAIFEAIQKGKIEAIKVGRNYIIPINEDLKTN